MRKLASIQKIKALEPIENADAIVKATVLGWQLVVKKDEFKLGELCVYCEIDSLLPDKPEFEFMKPRNRRVRTIRLRGQISQGICFPLSILPQGTVHEEGEDVTEILEIIKYEAPIPTELQGEIKGMFPSFIPKTDETRVQVLQNTLEKYVGELCYVTEKLDGTSVTFYLNNGEFGVCSRNLDLLETENNSIWKSARDLNIENKLKSLNKNIALQGELVGHGVQGNKYKLQGKAVYFFNIFDINNYCYFDFKEMKETLALLNLNSVPVIETNFELIDDIETLVLKSIGKSTLCNVYREGIVIRPLTEMRSSEGRVSFKSINPEFLLKYE